MTVSDLVGRPNYYISESQAVQECYGLLAWYDSMYKLEFLFVLVLVLFLVFLLYKLYYGKFNKVNRQVESLQQSFDSWELELKNRKSKLSVSEVKHGDRKKNRQ
jgi:hypothetical protein